MWKTVSMRIRGAATELEEAGEDTDGVIESTSELQALIKGMTGFDILEDDGETFKSTYDIILGIGKEWKNLTDVQSASLLEALAGKRQGNALAAALNNIEDMQKAYEAAENSAGSALEEQQKYTQSVQYSLDRLTASWQELSEDFLSSKTVKSAVDFVNKLINGLDWVIDKLGTIPTLLTAISAAMSFKNKGGAKMIALMNMPFLNCNNELCA